MLLLDQKIIQVLLLILTPPFTQHYPHIVKVWNRNGLVHTIKGHLQPIISLLVPSPDCPLPPETPFFLSCSSDGSVVLWNADSGRSEYRNETQYEWLGMRLMGDSSVLTYTSGGMWIWSLAQRYAQFSHILYTFVLQKILTLS
jgi:WD40 repeat protein